MTWGWVNNDKIFHHFRMQTAQNTSRPNSFANKTHTYNCNDACLEWKCMYDWFEAYKTTAHWKRTLTNWLRNELALHRYANQVSGDV